MGVGLIVGEEVMRGDWGTEDSKSELIGEGESSWRQRDDNETHGTDVSSKLLFSFMASTEWLEERTVAVVVPFPCCRIVVVWWRRPMSSSTRPRVVSLRWRRTANRSLFIVWLPRRYGQRGTGLCVWLQEWEGGDSLAHLYCWCWWWELVALCGGSGISHCRPPARPTSSVPLCWEDKGPPAACVGAHRHPWAVGTRGRSDGSGGRSTSSVEGGNGGLLS